MNERDNSPAGLLLFAQKSDTLVQLTLPEDNWQIYTAKYMPYLSTEEEPKLEKFERLEDVQRKTAEENAANVWRHTLAAFFSWVRHDH